MFPPNATRSSFGSIALFESETTGREIRFLSGISAVLAGFLTAFTVSVVGEMPVGEFVLIALAGWVAINLLVTKEWPCDLLRHKLLWILLGAQALGMCGYIFSDLYHGSSIRDIARGWGRMGFLWIDILAFGYLVGCSPRNFYWYFIAQIAGDGVHTILDGALFGDWWKFGAGVPFTYLVLALSIRGGLWSTILVSAFAAVLHFAMDFRSFGGICLFAAALTGLRLFPRHLRLWVMPVMLIAILAAFLIYPQIRASDAHRSTRSDVSRSSMIIAAWEGIRDHPLSGNGSWFSNTDVLQNFMLIRQERARIAHVGGFPEANERAGTVAFHTQILVSIAEGGIFGGAFFIIFGALLVRALYRLTFSKLWHGHYAIISLFLVSALWNVGFSPFSGAQRVYIAAACGVLLLLEVEGKRPGFVGGKKSNEFFQ